MAGLRAGHAPGMRRRVLWQHEGQAARFYRAEPGASVPLHTHRQHEERLMVPGELLLDDTLLREVYCQLVPAGTSHRIADTVIGAVIFGHGNLDLRFVG
jgi:hypothetical protein